jgi:hypothetical protein
MVIEAQVALIDHLEEVFFGNGPFPFAVEGIVPHDDGLFG